MPQKNKIVLVTSERLLKSLGFTIYNGLHNNNRVSHHIDDY